jgi:DinB superfamily
MPTKLQYSREEFVAELERQSALVQTLAAGLNDAALNWQPNGGKSWSVAQCLDHLSIMNAIYLKALQEAVESNRDQLEPRKVPIQASGWLMRLFIRYEEPPPKIKLPAPTKISPPSKLTTAVISEFQALQKQLADFVREWGGADLGDLKVRDPLFPLHLTVDTELLIIAAHNRRHLWQAENVKKNTGFPQN